ncbi:hypothetical protein M8C21_018945 [Ambrosia artemisiifolia]|uniref:PGG domain-containing protein n=1 Tax=Ambrosia artemisiifolia TaxID=4212 RepID=A0AAD5DB19_AMBAR|nr:hypothetical protein M8C21_018945 [Ambrosia artemisiifolia]
MLKRDGSLATKEIDYDGNTILHIAVGVGHNDFVREMLSYLNEDQVLEQRASSDGSTTLHVAAIVGNTYAAKLLVRKNKQLLEIKDMQGDDPLHKAYKNMQFDTIEYLLEAVYDYPETNSQTSQPSSVDGPDEETGIRLLINAISAKQYSFAAMLVKKFPGLASKDHEEVLTAIAKNFPSELHFKEKLICPLHSAFSFIWFLMLMVYFPILPLYSLCWKGAKILVEPIKQIENKKKEWDEANELLELVCEKIDSKYKGKHHSCYTRPFFEAACHNAYKVVNEILSRSPDILDLQDKNGYDIIKLAIIHRSEKIYNLIYDIGERKNLYRTSEYPFGNNILHLSGKLAPSSVLNKISGAALQLQRELQWREEVKKLVLPKDINKENRFKETPDMIFTREHKHLVKEGEQWMKTTAESCSIAAALISTIVFSAAITVPGGNNQEKGTPLFEKESAFIVFAVSDAISLFSSLTALLVFLSILTTRFAEEDFLFNLPRRLFIGLFSLLLSTTAMMVAFSATLFLVFSDEKLWILAPICGSAIIPIAFFVGLQFPLMVDLFRNTRYSQNAPTPGTGASSSFLTTVRSTSDDQPQPSNNQKSNTTHIRLPPFIALCPKLVGQKLEKLYPSFPEHCDLFSCTPGLFIHMVSHIDGLLPNPSTLFPLLAGRKDTRSPDMLDLQDENGNVIIKLAIRHRSEKIYNLIYDIGERKNLYRTSKYPFGNNILHLARKLAPSSVLNKITGAALQLQRELQWRENVKNLVLPGDLNKENDFKETPDMVFTREHNNLVKEGEQWMKTTAESCGIVAALITTIVFAAVITVPGGNNQEKGTPLFEKESAFIVFAISDAISLFSSLIALMVFLSILTTRFAEKDFLFNLPR